MVTIFGLFLLQFFPEYVYLEVFVNPSPFANGTYGKPLYFNCTFPAYWESATLDIPGEYGFKFGIFNGGHCHIPLDRRNNYSIACHGNTLTYGILKPEDGTTWRCNYSYTNSTTSKKVGGHGTTTIILQPDEPVITLQETVYFIREGLALSIPCTFNGAPISSVTWEHNNTVLMQSNQNQPLILSFQNVSRTDAGNYTCNVTVNFKGTYTASEKVNLIVEYPPTLRSRNDTTVNEGTETVTLSCDILADGFPRNYSDLHWQHWLKNKLIRELDSDDPHTKLSSNRHTLTLKSVSSNDTGCYVCSMGNGISNLEGKINQTAHMDLVIQAKPQILDPKPEYLGQVGSRFKIKFEIVGQPAPHSSIIVQEGQAAYEVNKTEAKGQVGIEIYNKVIEIDGIIVELDFGKIQNKFRTTYQLIAENSMGNITHMFVVEGHDFPSKPFHIHVKAYEDFALLEWEAMHPDTDMMYEVILKNYTGVDDVFRIPGQNSKVYEYQLTNLSSNKDSILQLCTTNVLGRNCSSTFKIKMDSIPRSLPQVSGKEKPKSEMTLTWIVLFVVGGIGLLAILIFMLFVMQRRRKSKNSLFLERSNGAFGRNRYSLQRLTSELESSENNRERDDHLCVNTNLTPQCRNSPLLGSTSCQLNSEGNEYAGVDDPVIMKMNTQFKSNNGICHTNGGTPMETNCSPNLPRQSNGYMPMDEQTKGILKSNISESTELKIPGHCRPENCQSTKYVSMGDGDEEKLDSQNGVYHEINYPKPKRFVRK